MTWTKRSFDHSIMPDHSIRMSAYNFGVDVVPGSLGYLPTCSAHRATLARPQVADSGMTFC